MSKNNVYINKAGAKVIITEIIIGSQETAIKFMLHRTGKFVYSLDARSFAEEFRPYVHKKEKTANNINQDIINLLENYNFTSFYGTTIDGKEFHVEVGSQ